MSKERKHSEEREIQLEQKLDEKVQKKMQKDAKKAEKRKNSKFRNSKFGQKWFGLKKWKRVTVYVVLVILLLALVAFGTVYGVFNGFRAKVDEGNLGITTDISDKYGKTDIFNVALFGVDTRDKNSFSGRSDSIIIVSIDRTNNTIKLSSILRDSYVAIEGHKNQKITHAYAFGGAELAVKTINQNFGMNITDYVTVNFYKLGDAIDILGGIDIEITEAERKQVNSIGDDDNSSFNYIESAGQVHLTGEQAVVYARIRKIDSDIERSNRQRKVIEALLVQARKVSPSKYGEIVRTMMSLCETSLSFTEVMSFAPMMTKDISIQSLVIPGEEDNATGGTYEGAWVWRYDLTAATQRLHEFIYGEAPGLPSQNSNQGNPSTTTTRAPVTAATPASSPAVPATNAATPKPNTPTPTPKPEKDDPEDNEPDKDDQEAITTTEPPSTDGSQENTTNEPGNADTPAVA